MKPSTRFVLTCVLATAAYAIITIAVFGDTGALAGMAGLASYGFPFVGGLLAAKRYGPGPGLLTAIAVATVDTAVRVSQSWPVLEAEAPGAAVLATSIALMVAASAMAGLAGVGLGRRWARS